MMHLAGINAVAVLAAGVVSFVVGFAWYSPFLFGNIWAKAMKINPKKMKMGAHHIIGAFAVNTGIAFGLAYLFNELGVDSFGGGVVVTFMAWLCFVATSVFSEVLWASKPPVVYGINVGSFLVSMLASAYVLTWFM